MMSVRGDKVSAQDLSKIVMINSDKKKLSDKVLSNQDLADQEKRRMRKVRKMVYEER